MIASAICTSLASPLAAQSLYDETTFRSLTADHKAVKAGDVLTVQIIESASAAVNADTDSQRGNSLSADVVRSNHSPLSVGLGTTGQFEGGGRTERAGRLVAQLTVTVSGVLANGDLLIGGEQQLTINDEKQRMALSGRVRRQDVSSANVVLSTRIADASITYLGEGHLTDRQKPAWWRRLLNDLGL